MDAMEEFEKLDEECEIYLDMQDDPESKPEDFYEAFKNMCLRHNDKSMIPYSVFCSMIEDCVSCEEYYMQMLMDVYSTHVIGEDFLDVLQQLIDDGYCDEYQKKTHEMIKDHVKDGYVIAYRGEFAAKGHNNLPYTESVSYSLDYQHAEFFATRFKMLGLTRSVVYTVKVPVEDVLAYIERENEVVCLPISRGGKMTVIKEESKL